MNKARDLIALAIESFRSGEFDAAAKFFASAVGSDDLDNFVGEIAKSVPRAARNGSVPFGENTLNPSLASASDFELDGIVDQIEARFRAECSLLDDDEEESEVRASEYDDDDQDHDDDLDDGDLDYEEEEDELEDEAESDPDYDVEASADKRKFVTVIGPVRLRK